MINEFDADLFDAVEFGNLDYTKTLLTSQNIDAQDLSGTTILMLAVKYEHKNIVAYLLAQYANVVIEDQSGKTALDYAEESGNSDIINLLKRGTLE